MEALFQHLQDQIYAVQSLYSVDAHAVIQVFYDLRSAYDKLPTNPTFKFTIGQEVWFLKNNKVQKGNVRVRQITESSKKLEDEYEYFHRNTDAKVLVVYCLQEGNREIDPIWQLEEAYLFASKQELLESL